MRDLIEQLKTLPREEQIKIFNGLSQEQRKKLILSMSVSEQEDLLINLPGQRTVKDLRTSEDLTFTELLGMEYANEQQIRDAISRGSFSNYGAGTPAAEARQREDLDQFARQDRNRAAAKQTRSVRSDAWIFNLFVEMMDKYPQYEGYSAQRLLNAFALYIDDPQNRERWVDRGMMPAMLIDAEISLPSTNTIKRGGSGRGWFERWASER